MNKSCARCEKIVYPIEELKCLDKIWHKGCFKCQECSMTLNMKTYKGYGKNPYCEAHIPKVKPTTMAETPELKRIAENTKIQSNVKYHADFEKSKGKFTQVADDPETLRIKANSKIISNVAYHGDLEKKAAMEKQRTINDNGEVVELPTTDNYQHQIDSYVSEMLPPSMPPPAVPLPQTTAVSQVQRDHRQNHNRPSTNNDVIFNSRQPTANNANNYNANNSSSTTYYGGNVTHNSNQSAAYGGNTYDNYNESNDAANGYNQNRNQNNHHADHGSNHHYLQQQHQNVNLSYSTHEGSRGHENQRGHEMQRGVEAQRNIDAQRLHEAQRNTSGQRIGRIADYDPISDGPRSSPLPPRQGATVVYNSAPANRQPVQGQGQGHLSQQQLMMQQQQSQQQMLQQHQQLLQQQQQQQMLRQAVVSQQQTQSPRRIGSVADMDPANDPYSGGPPAHMSSPHHHHQQQQQQPVLMMQPPQHQMQQQQSQQQMLQQQQQQMHLQQMQQQQQQQQLQQQHQQQQQMSKQPASAGIPGRVYIAMYDYEATDSDEVSFREGDMITNVSAIDEGWMTGRVERTARTGMLPANYVELAQI